MTDIKKIMTRMIRGKLDDSELDIFVFDGGNYVIFDDLTKAKLKKFFNVYHDLLIEVALNLSGKKLVKNHTKINDCIDLLEYEPKKKDEIDMITLVYHLMQIVKSLAYTEKVTEFLK